MVIASEALGRCVNALPSVAAWQYNGRESNPQPVDCKSSALTCMPPRQMYLDILKTPFN